MKQLTWLELSKLHNGDVVVFVTPHDIFPDALVPAGTRAAIAYNNLNEITTDILVLPESLDLQQKLKEWDGAIILSPHLYGGAAHNDDAVWQELSPLALEQDNV